MRPQGFAVSAVFCATLVLGGWAAGLVGPGSRSIESDSVRIAVDPPQATAVAENGVDGASIVAIIEAGFSDLAQMPPPQHVASASTLEPAKKDVEASALSIELPDIESILASLPDPQEMLAPVAAASVSTPDPVQKDAEALPFEVPEMDSILAALPDPREVPPQATPPVRRDLTRGRQRSEEAG